LAGPPLLWKDGVAEVGDEDVDGADPDSVSLRGKFFVSPAMRLGTNEISN
jgi:hypothetical protein